MQINIDTINESLKTQQEKFIYTTDEAYRNYLKAVAEDIISNIENKPLLLISGPSGSGKTTTAKMLEKYLSKNHIKTHTVSIDNYFNSLTQEEISKLDMESPDRVNSELLNEQLQKIIDCKEVELPRYDFINSKSVSSGKVLKRNPGEVVIIEGTHALNPKVIALPDETTFKLYISVRTRVSADGIILHPRKIRLLRRMIRDKNYRGRDIIQTIEKFNSVRRGEDFYIMPYKHRANYEADTFFSYELCIYKKLIFDDIMNLGELPETEDIIAVLSRTEELDVSKIPINSLIREFIGGGEFEY